MPEQNKVCTILHSNLGLEVNIGGGHLGNLEDADGQRDGAQDEQTVVDQDPGQDGMSHTPVTGDTKGNDLDQTIKKTVLCDVIVSGENVGRMESF